MISLDMLDGYLSQYICPVNQCRFKREIWLNDFLRT